MQYYGIIGDMSPLEHQGGVVFEGDCGPELIYFQPWGDGGEKRVSVYTTTVDDDLLEDHHWWSSAWEMLARSYGLKVEELREYAGSEDPLVRAQVLEILAGYYGWSEFDETPEEMTLEEAEAEYEEIVTAAQQAANAR